MEIVHQTEKHDWYKGRVDNFPGSGYSMLYNIVPKGEKPPNTYWRNYIHPRIIMDKMGYPNLRVYQTFSKPSCI